MGSFTPLVFSTFGGMGHDAAAVFYKTLGFHVSLWKGFCDVLVMLQD